MGNSCECFGRIRDFDEYRTPNNGAGKTDEAEAAATEARDEAGVTEVDLCPKDRDFAPTEKMLDRTSMSGEPHEQAVVENTVTPSEAVAVPDIDVVALLLSVVPEVGTPESAMLSANNRAPPAQADHNKIEEPADEGVENQAAAGGTEVGETAAAATEAGKKAEVVSGAESDEHCVNDIVPLPVHLLSPGEHSNT